MIKQWGNLLPPARFGSLYFPMSFTSLPSVNVTRYRTDGEELQQDALAIGIITKSYFKYNTNYGYGNNHPICWFAIGF